MRETPLSAAFGMVPVGNATHAYTEAGTIKGVSERVYVTIEIDRAVLVVFSPHLSRIERVEPSTPYLVPQQRDLEVRHDGGHES